MQVGAGGAGGAGSGDAGTGGGSGRYGGVYEEVGETAEADTYEFKVPLGAGGDFLQVSKKTKKARKKSEEKKRRKTYVVATVFVLELVAHTGWFTSWLPAACCLLPPASCLLPHFLLFSAPASCLLCAAGRLLVLLLLALSCSLPRT